MALADAVERMRQFAEHGRIGAGHPVAIVRLETTRRIVRGEAAIIAWETVRVREVSLSVAIPGLPGIQNRVAARGQRSLHDLPVGRTTVWLRATPAAGAADRGVIERRATIEVEHPAPVIEVIAARRATLGETFEISWRIREAERALLSGPDGERRIELEGAAEFSAHECGRIYYVLRAFGRGGTAERRVSVHVLAPELHIEAQQHTVAGFGRAVSIPYRVTGAAKLVLCSIDRSEPDRLIHMRGTISLDGVTASERFAFVATAFDGEIHTQVVTIEVTAAPSLHDLLNGRN